MNTRFPMRGRFKQTTLENAGGTSGASFSFGTAPPAGSGSFSGDIHVMLPPVSFTDNPNTARWPIFLWIWDGSSWDLMMSSWGSGANFSDWHDTDTYFDSIKTNLGLSSSFTVLGIEFAPNVSSVELNVNNFAITYN